MRHLIGRHWDGDICETWWGDDVTNEVTIERSHDVQSVLDMVAAVNAEGTPVHDGIGGALGEIDPVLAAAYCAERGIDVAKFLYSNEYRDEVKRFFKIHDKFAYDFTKRLHTVQ